MSDAEEERSKAASFARMDEDGEEQEDYEGSRHDSGRKHNRDRRRREEEEEEEEGEGEEDEEDEEDEGEDDEDDEDEDEGVSRGNKRQKVSCPILHEWSIPNTKVVSSAVTNALR